MTNKQLYSPEIKYSQWAPNDAPLFIILGQSNSYGHGTQLPLDEEITQGLKNVFTLSLSEVYSVDFPTINWTGLTSFGNANIGSPVGSPSGNQDHPINAANRFAKLWQDHISQGNALNLPDLYVILMGWGGQGMYLDNPPDNRWAPERDPCDVESLYPRAVRTLRMAVESLRKLGKILAFWLFIGTNGNQKPKVYWRHRHQRRILPASLRVLVMLWVIVVYRGDCIIHFRL
ncbi:hypothetical protein [Photorhabdus luminescens]|uniref:hypothetical protein n=1 Tax=Photorhabdus luminescens TaxID=29488 RepID=UPI00210CEAF2|nr:hypothetical protein [Photorhabdus luminescens]